ncbi:hypothetical protein ABFS83_04G129900 [Erythranthe nasuta]
MTLKRGKNGVKHGLKARPWGLRDNRLLLITCELGALAMAIRDVQPQQAEECCGDVRVCFFFFLGYQVAANGDIWKWDNLEDGGARGREERHISVEQSGR